MATTMPAQAPRPTSRPGPQVQQPAKKKSRAGRDLPAAILVGAGIGGVLIATLVFVPRFWVVYCAGAISLPATRWCGGCGKPAMSFRLFRC